MDPATAGEPNQKAAETSPAQASPQAQAGASQSLEKAREQSDQSESDRPAASPQASARVVTPVQLDPGFRQVAGRSPRYPMGARRAGVVGEVQMELEIAPNGLVDRVEIVQETSGWGFGEAVRLAYLAARFSPPTMAGKPVRVRWRRTLRFSP